MTLPRIIIIGGAPLAGKTALARSLSAELEYSLVSTDDISAALRSVTSAHSHPNFHFMMGEDYRCYYSTQTIVQLVMDAERYQEAIWPAVESIIRYRYSNAIPAIVEGWAIQPERVGKLELPEAASVWLVTSEALYEQRLRSSPNFLEGAPDIERMVRHFVRRSVWYDLYIRKIAQVYELPLLEVTPDTSDDDLLDAAMDIISRPKIQRRKEA